MDDYIGRRRFWPLADLSSRMLFKNHPKSPGRPRRLAPLGNTNPPHIGTPASIHTALVPRATQATVSPSWDTGAREDGSLALAHWPPRFVGGCRGEEQRLGVEMRWETPVAVGVNLQTWPEAPNNGWGRRKKVKVVLDSRFPPVLVPYCSLYRPRFATAHTHQGNGLAAPPRLLGKHSFFAECLDANVTWGSPSHPNTQKHRGWGSQSRGPSPRWPELSHS